MGIYDRDYIRGDASRTDILSGPGSMCRRIIIVTVAVWIAQLFGATPWLQLDERLFQGQVWRLVTYGFTHSLHPIHIFFNMYFLWIMGQDLEVLYGPREFLRFYLGAVVFSAVMYVLLMLATMGLHPDGRPFPAMVGASGAVMAVLVVMAMVYPTRQLVIFFVIPLELRWVVWLYAALDLYPLLMELSQGAGVSSGVAHGAHLGGMLYGFLYRHYDWRWDRLTGGWLKIRRQARAARSNMKLYSPPDEHREEPAENLDSQVDAILGKISRDGEASLTEAERNVLKEASRKYKDRR